LESAFRWRYEKKLTKIAKCSFEEKVQEVERQNPNRTMNRKSRKLRKEKLGAYTETTLEGGGFRGEGGK